MGLPTEAETFRYCWQLGGAAVLMIAFGYPGETTGDIGKRWLFWCISMTPFCFIVYTLFIGLKGAQEDQPDESTKSQVKWACWATIFSWCTYPIVYTFPMFAGVEDGKEGLSAESVVAVQIGYTISDVISKCGVGYLVYRIGLSKSASTIKHSVLSTDPVIVDSVPNSVTVVTQQRDCCVPNVPPILA